MHERSRTFDPDAFEWTDQAWTGRQLAGSVLYELHLGTFTPEGTLDAAVERLDHLVALGVDLVELLPVNAFNGTHNWGYDGVLWSAVHEQYGGPAAYQRFVDAAHAAGLGVIQDVVYNHLGPSGNYLPLFGPYLKAEGENTWGSLVNLDGQGSAEVRRYILDSALTWLRDHHVDGLRLDAVHALSDDSDLHLLEELGTEVAALSAHLRRPLTLIAESDLNDALMVTPREAGGLGMDAQWSDDFHHALHVALTGETSGYYADFEPLSALVKVCERGFFHDGTLLLVPRPRPRCSGPHRDDADLAAGGVQPEPRPGRQPGRGRPARRAPRRGPAAQRVRWSPWPGRSRRCCSRARSGRRPRRSSSSPPTPSPSSARPPPRAGSASSSRWAGTPRWCPTRRTPRRSAAPGSTGPSSEQDSHARVLAAYQRLAELRRSLPALTDPSFASVSCTADEQRRVFTLRRGDLLVVVNFGDDPAELIVEGDLTLLFRTPSRPELADGRLSLPPHAGALLGPAGPWEA